jgi:hypothetical protein
MSLYTSIKAAKVDALELKVSALEQEVRELKAHIESATKTKRALRGYRLPEYWAPSEPTVQWANEKSGLSSEKLRTEFEKFCDYWHSATGRGSTKQNWDAAFRNWIRKATESSARPRSNRWSHIDQIQHEE